MLSRSRSSTCNATVTTFITRLDPPDGPGLRLAVKDCIDVAGVPTTVGCAALAEGILPAARDAACLAGARAADARIVGKTNLHELCFGATGVNPHFGTPVNPLDPARIPGGSSSGSAVAVATGEADVAYGTDTAGSVRNPAACCGIVGLKTTHGRISLNGLWPLAPTMDSVGPMAADVAGAVAGMAMLEPGFVPATTRPSVIGRFRVGGIDPRIDAAVDAALAALGVEIVEVRLRGWSAAAAAGSTIMFAEALVSNASLYPDHRDLLGPDVAARFDAAAQLSDGDVAAARDQRLAWQDELREVFAEVSVIALPGYPVFPPRIDAASTTSNPTATPVSLAGIPGICVPVPTVDGPPTALGGLYPASLQLIGPWGSEADLVAVAAPADTLRRT